MVRSLPLFFDGAVYCAAFEQAAAAFVKWEVHTFCFAKCDSPSRENQRRPGIKPESRDRR
jgi:hypothetical protein